MTLRRKTIYLISIVLTGVLAVAYFVTQSVLLDGFTKLEEQEVREGTERTISALDNRIDWLEGTTSDWAFWDDTYAFTSDLNAEYIAKNITKSMFESLDLNAIAVTQAGGRFVYGRAYSTKDREFVDLPQGLLTYLTSDAHAKLLSSSATSIGGVVALPEDIMLISSCQILTSAKEGPSRGVLTMVCYLSTDEIAQLSETTLLPVSIYAINSTNLPDDFVKARQQLTQSKTFYILPQNSKLISGYALINDIYGSPALIMRVDSVRDIYGKGQDAVFFTLGILLVSGILAGIVSIVFQDKITLSRIKRLKNDVNQISTSGNLATRVKLGGKDELSNLAGDINKMLDTIEKYHQKEADLRSSLEAEMKKRADYTRELAHELKTPLTPILSSSELLAENIKEEPWASLAKNVYRGASDMNDRLDDLLDVAKGEVGILRLSLEDVEPAPFIQQIAEEMLPLIKNHKQKMTIDLPTDLPHIRGDEVRLRQILRNLLNNATKFTSEEGRITVRARRDGDKLVIDIEDTGRGIDSEKLDKIFQPYVRLGDDKDQQKGLGLGLKLSKTLVELHGGQIWVKSQKGKGSVFSFSIPVSSAYEKSSRKKNKIQ